VGNAQRCPRGADRSVGNPRIARSATIHGRVATVDGWVIHGGAKPNYLYRNTCISINYLELNAEA
jgi:hypothetical protein